MNHIKTVMLSLSATLFILVAALLTVGKTTAHAQAAEEPNNNQPAAVVYSYSAQPGDSYSLIARKAVQTYGIKNKVNLSQAQIIFVETNLTKAANSPELQKSEKVEIKEDQIKEWVDKAGSLTDTQKAAWDVYAQHANFNTDNVGQSK